MCRLRRSQGGFTLIELTVAATVVLIALSAMGGLFVNTIQTVAVAKQRQQAVALANQALESMRAVPYTTLAAGLNVNDLTGDENITGTDFKPRYDGGIAEPLMVTGTIGVLPPASPPLYPHSYTPVLDTADSQGATFTVSNYVTRATADPPSFNITSIVTWVSNVVTEKKTVALRSQVFSPDGCLDLAKHPFSGPCQAQFKAVATRGLGSITLRPTVDSSQLFAGADAGSLTLALPEAEHSLQVEQITGVSGQARSSQTFVDQDTTGVGSGGLAVATLADTDPSNADNTSAGALLAAQTDGAATVTGSDVYASAVPHGGDSGSAASMTSASSTAPVSAPLALCRTAEDTPRTLNTLLPCGSSHVVPAGSAAQMTLGVGNETGRSLSLASMSSAAESRAMAARFSTTDSVYCPTATGLGCVAADTRRRIGDLVVARLDASGASGTYRSADTLVPGSSFSGLVKLQGYSDRARAGSGLGPAAPTVSQAGTVSFWAPVNPGADCPGVYASSYCTISLPTAAAQVLTPSVVAEYTGWDGLPIKIKATAELRLPGAPTTASSGSSPCQVDACTVSTSVDSPFTATVRYVIEWNGTTTDVTQQIDLGRTTSSTSYKAAPVE